jgi:hypothetical protein
MHPNRRKLDLCKLTLLLALLILPIHVAKAQDFPPDFGTPQGTARFAASAGFIDVLDIKLGMPAESAVATLKANNPRSTITLIRTGDYEKTWNREIAEDPKRKWVYEIDVQPSVVTDDKISVRLSLPPGKQVVESVTRFKFFQAPVAVENIVAGLRKKYGRETAGPTGVTRTLYDTPTDKALVWIYDPQGKQLNSADVVANRPGGCAMQNEAGMGIADITIRRNEWRTYAREELKSNSCAAYVILSARIQAPGAPVGINGMATSFEVGALHWPLRNSAITALYGFLDQRARQLADQEAQDAKKRGTDVKY